MYSKSVNVFILLSVSLFLIVSSYTAVNADSNIRSRYEAIVSAYQAMKAQGRITQSDKRVFDELQNAWREKRLESVSALINEIAERLAMGSGIAEPITIHIYPDWSISGPVDSFSISPMLLRNGIEFMELSTNDLDDMKLYHLLTSDSKPLVIAPQLNLPLAVDRFAPPQGWALLDTIKERWNKISSIAEAKTEIILPGIDLRRSDANLWLYTALKENPDEPLYVKGDLFLNEELHQILIQSKYLFIKPELYSDKLNAADLLWYYVAARNHKIALIVDQNFPFVEIIQQGFKGLSFDTKALIFSNQNISAFNSRERFIFLNTGTEEIRIDFIAPPLPSIRGIKEEGRDGRILEGRASMLFPDNRVEFQEMLYRKRLSFIMPSRAVVFLEIAIEN